jgi:hypothetical protein
MVGRRGEAPLVPPYILCNFKLDGTVAAPPAGLSVGGANKLQYPHPKSFA